MKTLHIYMKNDAGMVVDTIVRTLPDDEAERVAACYRGEGDTVRVREAREGDVLRDERRYQRMRRNAA